MVEVGVEGGIGRFILFDFQMGDVGLLLQVKQLLQRFGLAQAGVLPQCLCGSLLRKAQSCNDFQQGAFPRAVFPQQSANAPRLPMQAEPVEQRRLLVVSEPDLL